MARPKMDLSKLNKGRVMKLVAALRSGKYKQVRGALLEQDDDGNNLFCCLGVACDVYRKTARKGSWTVYNSFQSAPLEDESAFLPLVVARWFGFEDTEGYAVGDPVIAPKKRKHFTAIGRNDSEKESFDQIADRFEALVKDL